MYNVLARPLGGLTRITVLWLSVAPAYSTGKDEQSRVEGVKVEGVKDAFWILSAIGFRGLI